MKYSKLIFFTALIVLMLSVNFAFAADENSTQVISEDADDELAIDDVEEELTSDEVSDDTLNAVENENIIQANDDSNLLKENPNTIKMNGVIDRIKGGIWYKATFYDDDGNPLSGETVFFSLNDDADGWEVDTDSNGVAILKAKIKNGNYKLHAFHPNLVDVATVDLKVFDVVTGGKNINMYYDGGNTYKVRVLDNNGNPVKAGQKVTFLIDNKKFVKKTDKKGFAALKITAKPGYYNLYAVYKNFYISNKLKVKTVLKAKTGKIKSKKNIKFKVKFLGKNKKNKLIKVKFNKKTYKVKTNKKGVAVFKLKYPKKLGRYNIVVSYKKLKEYYYYSSYYA